MRYLCFELRVLSVFSTNPALTRGLIFLVVKFESFSTLIRTMISDELDSPNSARMRKISIDSGLGSDSQSIVDSAFSVFPFRLVSITEKDDSVTLNSGRFSLSPPYDLKMCSIPRPHSSTNPARANTCASVGLNGIDVWVDRRSSIVYPSGMVPVSEIIIFSPSHTRIIMGMREE